MKSIIADINNHDFKRVYLLYGEEGYLRNQYKKRLQEAIIGEDSELNFSHFEGKDTPVNEVISLANTLPFMSEKRLIIIDESGLFKKKNEELAMFMKDIPEETCLIFSEVDVDKRGKLYKEVVKAGTVVEMTVQKPEVLLKWAAGLLKKDNMRIKESTLRLFLSKVGNNMGLIETELEKLICFRGEGTEITPEDVELLTTTQIENHIFQMVDAVASKQKQKAMEKYYELLALKEEPRVILSLLARQFRLLYGTKKLVNSGKNKGVIAKIMGLPPFVVDNYIRQQKGFSADELREIMEEAADFGRSINVGELDDRVSVELFIVKHTK